MRTSACSPILMHRYYIFFLALWIICSLIFSIRMIVVIWAVTVFHSFYIYIYIIIYIYIQRYIYILSIITLFLFIYIQDVTFLFSFGSCSFCSHYSQLFKCITFSLITWRSVASYFYSFHIRVHTIHSYTPYKYKKLL